MEYLTVTDRGDESVVTLDLAKLSIRQTLDLEDDLIFEQIRSAEDWASDFTRRPIRRQTLSYKTRRVPLVERLRQFRLRGYVSSVTSVQYRADGTGTLTTVDGPGASPGPAIYTVVTGDHVTYLRADPDQDWPDAGDYNDAWQVTYIAGWIATDVPLSVREGVLMKLRHLFDADEAAGNAAESMLSPWRLPPW